MASQYPLFTLRTAEIVGRQETLAQIRRARSEVTAPDTPTRLFYLVGEGGMGKTRLLEELQREKEEFQNQLVTGIIDFYDSHHHSSTNLVESIVRELSLRNPDVAALFAGYRTQLTRFRELSAAGMPGDYARSGLDGAFDAAWDELTRRSSVVILLDTAELLQFQEDDVCGRLGLDPAKIAEITARSWLKNVVQQNKLPRTLIVIAGRERSGLSDELRKLASRDGHTYVNHVTGLSAAESEDYFDRLAATLRDRGHTGEADDLSALTPTQRTQFALLTGGRPIALAVALQLYVSNLEAKAFDDLLHATIPDYDAKTQSVLRKALVEGVIYGAFGDINEPLRIMPLARRGLTPEILRELWGESHTEQECSEVLTRLKGQVFTKTRPDGSLVLHDEIADWTEFELYRDSSTAIASYKKLANYYSARFKQTRTRIHELGKKTNQFLDPQEGRTDSSGLPEATPLSIGDGVYGELLEQVQLRRQLAIDLLYYALRADPVWGFQHYYELAEEAFNVNLADYDAQIHSEFRQWWDALRYQHSKHFKYRAEAGNANITPELVEADLAIRWVQRQFNRQESDAKAKAAALADLAVTRLKLDAVARHKLQTYAITARSQTTLTDEEIEQVNSSFDANIRRLRAIYARAPGQIDTHIAKFLAADALAFAHYEAGLFETNVLGHFDTAIEHFTASILLYKELKFEINRARSLNDRGYALAMAGELDSAMFSINDALDLRIELGLARLVALSMNTKGLIHTYALKPNTAILLCQRAYDLFKTVEDRWGQMLALRALSEAHRRKADADGIPTRGRYDALVQARTLIEMCLNLARLLQAPPAILADIIGEHGCALRDLARFCAGHRDLCDSKLQVSALIDEAQKNLDDALVLVQPYLYLRHLAVDFTVDQAYLAFFFDDLDKAAVDLQRALDLVPVEYLDAKHAMHERRHAYRVQLSKIFALRARLSGGELNRCLESKRSDQLVLAAAIDQFAEDATWTLYYTAAVPDFRQARKANEVIYNQLRTLPAAEQRSLCPAAHQQERKLGIPPQVAKKHGLAAFIHEHFGVK